VLPFVRSYLLTQVDDSAPLHRWAIDYYDARKKPYPWDIFEERDRELGEVQDYLELFHHHFEIGEYEQAFDVVYDGNETGKSINRFLSFRGFQQERITIYERLIDFWHGQIHWHHRVSLTCLGNIYRFLEDYQKAIDYHEKSLTIAEQMKDKHGEAKSLCNLGNAYEPLREYEKAINYYEQSLIIKQQINDKQGEAISLNGLGNVYRSLGECEKAISYYEQSLIIKRKINDKQGEAISLNELGNVYRSLGECEKAIDCYEKSLTIKRKIKDKRGEAYSLMNLGEALRDTQKPQAARDALTQARALFAEMKQLHYVEKCDNILRDLS